jgi:hypothetical protein
MSNNFQRQALTRKLVYGGLILALFTGTLFYRPLVLESQARELALREEDQGEVELTGAAVNLTLTGSRGFALCGLWLLANEKQKKHEWNELRLLVRSITKLQPHFLSVWTFQSWNLAYNVSVVSDRLRDRYYWIAEGIQLAAEGERSNRNNPDMRFSVAFYYQDKIGIADQSTTYRSFLQMSAMDPRDRDPAALRGPDGRVDMVKFKAFLEKHPHFVRRLLGLPNIEKPEDVVRFLAENQDLPTLFQVAPGGKPLTQGNPRKKPLGERFPVFSEEDEEKDYRPTDDVDSYGISKRWHLYAQQPLPAPHPTPWLIAGTPLERTYFDEAKERLPKRPAAIIFRQYPARSQSYVAEKLQKEGWFEGGWEVDDGRLPQDRWFPNEKVVVGRTAAGSGKAWEVAYDMWSNHGKANHLLLKPADLEQKQNLAQRYRTAYHLRPGETGPRPPESADADLRLGWGAARQLAWYNQNRTTTNFAHFLAEAEVEKEPQALTARRLFFEAERRRKTAESAKALQLYEDPKALAAWRELMIKFPDFRHDIQSQEDAYTIQVRYLNLVHDQRALLFRQLLTVGDILSQAGWAANAVLLPSVNQSPLPAPNQARPKGVRVPLRGPFDSWVLREPRDAPQTLGPTLAGVAGGSDCGAFLALTACVAGNTEPLLLPEAVRRVRGRTGMDDPQAPTPPERPASPPPRPSKGRNE